MDDHGLWLRDRRRRRVIPLHLGQAEEIEQGVVMERFNTRGGGARDPKPGGRPEHDLAAEIRHACSRLETWSRTRAMLLNLARIWEKVAESGDLRAREQELRDA